MSLLQRPCRWLLTLVCLLVISSFFFWHLMHGGLKQSAGHSEQQETLLTARYACEEGCLRSRGSPRCNRALVGQVSGDTALVLLLCLANERGMIDQPILRCVALGLQSPAHLVSLRTMLMLVSDLPRGNSRRLLWDRLVVQLGLWMSTASMT